MFRRFFLLLRAWFGPTDPSRSREESESLLEQAQLEMRELHTRNRLRAVAAITEKNRLEKECEQNEDLRKRLDEAKLAVEEAKREIRREDERIREKTREALQLKAQWLESQRNIGLPPILRPELDANAIVFLLIVVDAALFALLLLSFRH